MAELATIARPYAEALFEASRGDLPGTQHWLDALAAAADEPQLLQFAANPKVNAAQVFQVVTSVLDKPLPDRGANFLRTVVENDRLAALPSVAKQFRELANEQGGRSDAVIYSALGLDFETGVSASATALANVGPGVGGIIGPAGNFASLSNAIKWMLCWEMIVGRLELMSVYVILIPAFWR